MYGGLIKQEIICKVCSYQSMKYEPFNILSLPIEFDSDKSCYAKLKVIYMYDIDKYKKYEIMIKPGQYNIKQVIDKIKSKIHLDRREVKTGKKTFVLADLIYDSTVLQKVFIEEHILLTFSKNQDLTTYAYEVPKG